MGKSFVLREFYCSDCGLTLMASKKADRQTPAGHIKHMWCPQCKVVTKFIQLPITSGIYK